MPSKKLNRSRKLVKNFKFYQKRREFINISKSLQRWTVIKRDLAIVSDEDFVSYLLNLAENDIRKAKSKTEASNFKEKKIDLTIKKLDKFKSRLNNENDTKETEELQPVTCQGEKLRIYKHDKLESSSSIQLQEDASNLIDEPQNSKKTDKNNDDSGDDDEKENLEISSSENSSRISADLNYSIEYESTRISTDNGSQNVSNLKNNNEILKDTEQNLDFSKDIRSFKNNKDLKTLNSVWNFTKCKKKKLSKHLSDCGKIPDTDDAHVDSSRTTLMSKSATYEETAFIDRNNQSDRIVNTKIPNSIILSESNCDNKSSKTVSDTPKVSITIKLCSDCESRHLHDSCPLRNPQKIIYDSVNLNQWKSDAINRGHSSHESVLREPQTDFASASLPSCLELKEINTDHGLSVIAKQMLPKLTQFGPLVGKPIKEMEIPDDFSMRNIWEIMIDGKCSYISTENVDSSNWFRWLRPAPIKEARNLISIQIESELYFVTSTSVAENEELLYWTDHVSSEWSNKKMIKTNCGGCNLRFLHPVYYKRHCVIFHDPKFSLTIRKYHCKICGFSVLGKEKIMKHAAESHNGKGAYQCQFCKKFFLRLNYLEMHRTYGCAANPHRTRPLCDYCGRKFCQPQKLKIHIKRMHSEISEVLKEFQCKRCMRILGSRAALQRHIKEVHHKALLCSYTCEKCGKMFQNRSNLKIHMLTHSGIKPFKCQEEKCSSAFTTKQCLQQHYKKVHGFSDKKMPTIERSVAYTFDAYAGGIVPDNEDSNCSSSNSNQGNERRDADGLNSDSSITQAPLVVDDENNEINTLNFSNADFTNGNNKLIASKASKKWMGDNGVDSLFSFNEENVLIENEHDIRKNDSVSMVYRNKPVSSNASLLVEAALDAAEKDIDMNFTPINLHSPTLSSNKINDNQFPIFQNTSNQLSPNREILKPITPMPAEYPLHSIPEMNQPGFQFSSHSFDSSVYPQMSPISRHTTNYGLVYPDRSSNFDLRLSPSNSAPVDTPHLHLEESRFDIHQRRLEADCSSDDGDGVQNLSLGQKTKPSLQLDYSSTSSYNKCDSNVEDPANNFIESSLEYFDMQRSSVFHHSSFVSMSSQRYPPMIYDQRATYSHSDVLRVVNLTHSVDLSLPRSNHVPIHPPLSLHHQPTNQSIFEQIRGVSPPPVYQNYPLSQSPYLSTNRISQSPTYHHYSGF